MPTRGRLIPALFILIVTAAALYVIWPASPRGVLPGAGVIPWPSGKGVQIGSFVRDRMRLGLDLQGGTRLLLRGTPDAIGSITQPSDAQSSRQEKAS